MKMTTAQIVETSVTVNNNSPIQDYVHPDDETQPAFETNSHRNHTNRIYILPKNLQIDRSFFASYGKRGGGAQFF